MVEPQSEEVLTQEINLDFFIKHVTVKVTEGLGYSKYDKLYGKIKDDKGEINFTQLSPEYLSVDTLMRKINKLYNVYISTDTANEKLRQGAKEEILKTIALLIWRLG
jgi:dephospho-CoA kinase